MSLFFKACACVVPIAIGAVASLIPEEQVLLRSVMLTAALVMIGGAVIGFGVHKALCHFGWPQLSGVFWKECVCQTESKVLAVFEGMRTAPGDMIEESKQRTMFDAASDHVRTSLQYVRQIEELGATPDGPGSAFDQELKRAKRTLETASKVISDEFSDHGGDVYGNPIKRRKRMVKFLKRLRAAFK